jgi:hypothetical protein
MENHWGEGEQVVLRNELPTCAHRRKHLFLDALHSLFM